MAIRASDLTQLDGETLRKIEEARRQIQIARLETERLKSTGVDTADEEKQILAMEAQLALFVENYGPGGAAKWARKARQGA